MRNCSFYIVLFDEHGFNEKDNKRPAGTGMQVDHIECDDKWEIKS